MSGRYSPAGGVGGGPTEKGEGSLSVSGLEGGEPMVSQGVMVAREGDGRVGQDDVKGRIGESVLERDHGTGESRP